MKTAPWHIQVARKLAQIRNIPYSVVMRAGKLHVCQHPGSTDILLDVVIPSPRKRQMFAANQ